MIKNIIHTGVLWIKQTWRHIPHTQMFDSIGYTVLFFSFSSALFYSLDCSHCLCSLCAPFPSPWIYHVLLEANFGNETLPPLKFNLKNVWTSQQLLRFFYCECAELLLCIKIQNHLDENSFQNLWWWFTGWHVRSLIRAVKVEMMSTGWGSLSDPSQLQGWKKKKRKEKKEKRMFILTSRDESKSEYYCLGGIG